MKLLSIILPIYNGGYIINHTLSFFKDQLIRNKEKVEFVICNNASTDDTLEVINKLEWRDNIVVIDNNDFVPFDNNLSRGIDKSSGEYLLFWGDDDIAFPTMIDTIVYYLEQYPDIGCFHFNRLTGHTIEENGIGNLHVFDNKVKCGEILYKDSKKFAEEHYQGMDFISCCVVKRNLWYKGKSRDSITNMGFDFMASILYGTRGTDCLYVEFPLCIHRASRRPRWVVNLPKYWFIGVPRILQDLEKYDIIDDWRKQWENSYYYKQSIRSFVGIMMNCTLNKALYRPLLKELCSYQRSYKRKLIAWFLVKYCPKILYEKRLQRHWGKDYKMDNKGNYPIIP